MPQFYQVVYLLACMCLWQMLLERGYDSCPHASDVCTEVMDMLGEDRSPSALSCPPSPPPHSSGSGSGSSNSSSSGWERRMGENMLAPVTFKRMAASGQASTVSSKSYTLQLPVCCMY
mgnify:CR=1